MENFTPPTNQLSYYDYSHWGDEFYSMEKYGPATRHGRRIIRQMVRNLPAQSILDVGCGNGYLIEELMAERNVPTGYFGCDISPSCIKTATKRLPDAHFFLFDVRKTPPQDLKANFDLIICSEVVEHIEDDLAALRHINQMVKKYALFTVPLEKQLSPASVAVGHYHAYSVKEFLAKLEKANFKILTKKCWGYPLYSPVYRSTFKDRYDLNWFKKSYTPFQKLLCDVLYGIFWFNLSVFGDRLFVLVEKNDFGDTE